MGMHLSRLEDRELFKCYNDYKKQWPFVADNFKSLDIPSFNIQRYLPGEHFAKIHTERSSTSTSHRLFAWMTYLNDLDDNDGGATKFEHFNISVKPKKGKGSYNRKKWIVQFHKKRIRLHRQYDSLSKHSKKTLCLC